MKLFIIALTLITVNAFAATYEIPNVQLNTSDFKVEEDEHTPNAVKYSKDGKCKLEKQVNEDFGYTTIYIKNDDDFFESIHFKHDGGNLLFSPIDFLKPKMCDFDVKALKNGNYNLNNNCQDGLNYENIDIEFTNDGIIKGISMKKQRFGSGHSIPIPAMSSAKIKCQF